jgi:hypothetical protein
MHRYLKAFLWGFALIFSMSVAVMAEGHFSRLWVTSLLYGDIVCALTIVLAVVLLEFALSLKKHGWQKSKQLSQRAVLGTIVLVILWWLFLTNRLPLPW